MLPIPDFSKANAAYLYRLYNAEACLLYVGVAVDLMPRLKVHSGSQFWWHEVTHYSFEEYPTRAMAEAAETAAICEEYPRYNQKKNPIWIEEQRRIRQQESPRPKPIRRVLKVDRETLAMIDAIGYHYGDHYRSQTINRLIRDAGSRLANDEARRLDAQEVQG